MNQTILLGINNNFSHKANKRLLIFLAVIFIINGSGQLWLHHDESFSIIIGGLLLIAGIYYLYYAMVAFSPTSEKSLKVALTQEKIQMKNSFWKPATHLKWNEISVITLAHQRIDFQLENTIYTFNYNTSAETSVEIKKAIRAHAESKNIEVIGG